MGILRGYLVAQVKLHRNRSEEARGALPGLLVAMQSSGDQFTAHPHLGLLYVACRA